MDFQFAYKSTFGDIPDGTQYHIHAENELIRAVNTEAMQRQAELKALTSSAGGAGTAGNAMVPVYVDSRIVDTTRKYTPLIQIFPRVTNLGKTADFNKITAKGGGYFAIEDAALPEKDTTYDRDSTAIKYLYSVGRVTGQSRAAFPSYQLMGFQPTGSGLEGSGFTPSSAPNAKQLEVIVKAREIRELEENKLVTGNATTSPQEFNGIQQIQGSINKVDKNTGALAYNDIEDAITAAINDSGRPNLAVCSTSVLADLRKIMINTFRYRPDNLTTSSLPWGVSSHLTLETSVGPIPVLFSQYLSNTSGSKELFFLDMNFWEMRV